MLEDARYGYLVFKEQNITPAKAGQTFNIRAAQKNASPISNFPNFSGPNEGR